MKTRAIHITQQSIRVFLTLFWLYVGLDKFWALSAIQIALTQQPIISPLASELYLILPVLELSIGICLAFPHKNWQRIGWLSSSILIGLFSIYIGLGVLDLYEKKPCMCTSFLNHISWTLHLLINLLILMMSLLGGWLFQQTIAKSTRLQS